MLTVGSLFSGIGGFDLGLERAGMRVLWQCEIDPYAQRVLAKHWPDVLRVPDIRGVDAGSVPAVDVLCGGFPCQDLSYAGAGAGLDGARSGLWSEYARVVGELRPRYVIVENVAALLARGLGRVLGDLAALGYDAEWDCIPASAVGAPHRRDRVWLVAYPEGDVRRSRVRDRDQGADRRNQPADCCGDRGELPDSNGQRLQAVPAQRYDPQGLASSGTQPPCDVGDSQGDGRGSWWTGRPDPAGSWQRESERPLQDADSCTLQPWRVGGRVAQAGGPEWWSLEPPVGRVAHGIPDRLDQLAALGNALVPQIAEWIGRRILEWEIAA